MGPNYAVGIFVAWYGRGHALYGFSIPKDKALQTLRECKALDKVVLISLCDDKNYERVLRETRSMTGTLSPYTLPPMNENEVIELLS